MSLQSQSRSARYTVMRNHGLVSDASPTRLVQIMFEQTLSNLTTAELCMRRIKDNLPLVEVKTKGAAMSRAVRLIGQLDASLDMEKGGSIAVNLRNLYRYMLLRLTQANVTNDPAIVAEVVQLVAKIKSGWDGVVAEGR
jgi:flagellar protein FliS